MTLWTLVFCLLTLICLGSAGYMHTRYWDLVSQVSSLQGQVHSIRSKRSYDESKIRDMIEAELDTLPRKSDAEDSGGVDMSGLMQAMMMQQMTQQTPAQAGSGPGSQPTSEGTQEEQRAGASAGRGGDSIAEQWRRELSNGS